MFRKQRSPGIGSRMQGKSLAKKQERRHMVQENCFVGDTSGSDSGGFFKLFEIPQNVQLQGEQFLSYANQLHRS